MAGSRPSTTSVTPWLGSPPQSAMPSGRVAGPPEIVPRLPSPIRPASTGLPAVKQAAQELPVKPRSRGGLASRFGKLAGNSGGLTSELAAFMNGLMLEFNATPMLESLPTSTIPAGGICPTRTYRRTDGALRPHEPVIGEPVLFSPNIESAPELKKRKPRADASLKKLSQPKPLDPAFRVTIPSTSKAQPLLSVEAPASVQFGEDTGVRELVMSHIHRSQSTGSNLGQPERDPFRFTITEDGDVIDTFDMDKFWEEESKPKFELTTVGASHLVALDASMLDEANKPAIQARPTSLKMPARAGGYGGMKYSTALNFVTPGEKKFRLPASKATQLMKAEAGHVAASLAKVGRFAGKSSIPKAVDQQATVGTVAGIAAANGSATTSSQQVLIKQPVTKLDSRQGSTSSVRFLAESLLSDSGSLVALPGATTQEPPPRVSSTASASRPISDQLKTEMLARGFVSTVSRDVCPVEGYVFVDTNFRLKGVEAVVFRCSLRAKVLASFAVALANKVPDVSSEDVDITSISNLGKSKNGTLRKVYQSSNLELIDNAIESEVRKFREAQTRQMELVKKTIGMWENIVEDEHKAEVEQRLLAKRIAYKLARRMIARRRRKSVASVHSQASVSQARRKSAEIDAMLAAAAATGELDAMSTPRSKDSDSGDSGDEILENLFGQDIDAEEMFGHLFLTSDLHNIPADYPEHYFGAAKHMSHAYEKPPEVTFKKQMSEVSLPGAKVYYNNSILQSACTQFQLRVSCPVARVPQLQRVLFSLCNDDGTLSLSKLDCAIP